MEDKRCDIYEHRPIMCNVKAMWRITGGSLISEWDNYITLQKEFCKFLRKRKNKRRI